MLGIGILLGAYWAYEELGWGGYWNWDPVENGSLIPWLTATAMIHAAMAYSQRGGLKRTTLVLAVATFAACNFAAFLTRSGSLQQLARLQPIADRLDVPGDVPGAGGGNRSAPGPAPRGNGVRQPAFRSVGQGNGGCRACFRIGSLGHDWYLSAR